MSLNGSDFLARNMFTNSLILIFVIMERFWICNWISFIHLIWLDWHVKTKTISLIFPFLKFYLNWLNLCWIWWMAASSELTNVISLFPPLIKSVKFEVGLNMTVLVWIHILSFILLIGFKADMCLFPIVFFCKCIHYQSQGAK
jgi:hypothetical protein